MSNQDQYHPNFRTSEASQIISTLDGGKCVSVIGAPSVGKTNLLRFLDQGEMAPTGRESPWERYVLEKNRARGRLVVISIDPNLLLPPLSSDPGDIAALSWPGFELFIHRLRNHPQLYPMLPDTLRGDDTAPSLDVRRHVQRMKTYQEIFDLAHENVTKEEDPLIGHLALRHLENLITAILEGNDLADKRLRLVFFIDEFDYLLAAMPNYFFVALRGIRDRFKYRVTYVTFTRNMLSDLVSRERMKVLEPFVELFNDKPVWLGPYSDQDAWQMVDRIEKRSVRRDDKALSLCIVVTGKFAGLLRATIEHTEDLQGLAREDYWGAAKILYEKDNVSQECETLLRNLTDGEIRTLYTVVFGQGEIDPKIAQELQYKSLLSWEGEQYCVQPYLLAVYIANHRQPPKGREPARPSTLPEGHSMR